MRVKDQSYITRLGFGDDDRRMSEHDLGCRYLASEDKVCKLALFLRFDLEALSSTNFYLDDQILSLCGARPFNYWDFLKATFSLTAEELRDWIPPLPRRSLEKGQRRL